jgi:hypothetical protein
MARKARAKLAWTTIDPTTLPAPLRKLFDANKVAYKAHAESPTAIALETARKAFEAALAVAMKPRIPAGQRLVVGYNFGRLSVALDYERGEQQKTGGTAFGAVALAAPEPAAPALRVVA